MARVQFTRTAKEKNLSAAEVVSARARALCFERKQDPTTFAHINAATIEVLQSDKALGEAYKRLEEADVDDEE